MGEFQKWWDETYGQILTIANDLDADASYRIAKIAAMDAWMAGRAALEAERDALRSGAAGDVLAERRRQIEAEGWTPEHDDQHDDNQLADAAAWYAASPSVRCELEDKGLVFWPWAENWWKPGDRRRELIKAAALILAEIERIDRAAIAAKEPNRE